MASAAEKIKEGQQAMASGREWGWRWWAPAAVALLGVLAYWLALNNPFVADDYAFFWYVDRLQGHWTDLALHPLGLRRVVSTLFFALCYKLLVLRRRATTSRACCCTCLSVVWSGCWWEG